MPQIAEEPTPAANPGLQGIVNSAPASLTAAFTVVCPGFSDDHAFEIRYWMPRGETLPVAGDRVLVLFDDNEEPWVIAWWPA